MAAENFCCPVTLIMIGSLLLHMVRTNTNKIDTIQAGLVDALFIEGDDVNEDNCKRWGSSLSVTCEKSQAEKYKQGSAGKTGKGGKPVGGTADWYLYSVGRLRLHAARTLLRPCPLICVSVDVSPESRFGHFYGR